MMQRYEIGWEEKYEMYNVLEKDSLIKMLIEANNLIYKLTPEVRTYDCGFYNPGMDTSGRCINCGKQQWEH